MVTYAWRHGDQEIPHGSPPDDWTEDPEWLKANALGYFEAVAFCLDETGVISILGPYVDAVESDSDKKAFPADFRQSVIDLWNAWYEVTVEILPKMQFIVGGNLSGAHTAQP